MSLIKKIIRHTHLFQTLKARRYFRRNSEKWDKLLLDEKANHKNRCIYFYGDKTVQWIKMLENISINIIPGKRFQSWIDVAIWPMHYNNITDNVPPQYEVVLNHSIEQLKDKYKQYNNNVGNSGLSFLIGIERYIDKIIGIIDTELVKTSDSFLMQTKTYFIRMKSSKAESLEEAFQRIIFWSSLFWQSEHRLVGIGRLDKILDRFELPEEKTLEIMICDFCDEMHRYYAFKSNGNLLGDTGQIIELGGLEKNGTYFNNALTYAFIRVMKEHNLPDPKILLRVHTSMPEDLLKLALDCIVTGVGYPLLSNDGTIIPALEKFGYENGDAYNYVTSACWEPLVYGKSLDVNNMRCINYAEPIVEMYSDEKFEQLNTFEQVVELYLDKLEPHLQKVIADVDKVSWEPDPLASLFTEDCLKNGKDISQGGAKYNNYGALGVGMANAVDSLLNLKTIMRDNQYSLKDVKDKLANESIDLDFEELVKRNSYYGKDDPEVIELVEKITGFVYKILSGYRNRFGGKLKWGLSASNYVEKGERTGTTIDGRKKAEPLAVHISGKNGTTYTELINFASLLNYEGQRANGNVVDFFISPQFIKNNFDKFIAFIKAAMKNGFFQMQMNVVCSSTLIDAKRNPDKYSGLIVRVWGFSAYFNDLPENYKDILIKRAIDSETALL